MLIANGWRFINYYTPDNFLSSVCMNYLSLSEHNIVHHEVGFIWCNNAHIWHTMILISSIHTNIEIIYTHAHTHIYAHTDLISIHRTCKQVKLNHKITSMALCKAASTPLHSADRSIKLSGSHRTQTQTSEVRWAARSSGHWVVASMFA